DPAEFAAAHMAGSINIGLGGQYATWAGALLDPSRPIVIVARPGAETQSAMRLGRIGFDRVEGFLDGGLATLDRGPDVSAVATDRLSPQTTAERMAGATPPLVIDVRTPHERAQKSISNTAHLPLNTLAGNTRDIPRDRAIVVFCAGGYRSSMAASVLQRDGFTNVSELAGGIAA